MFLYMKGKHIIFLLIFFNARSRVQYVAPFRFVAYLVGAIGFLLVSHTVGLEFGSL